MKRTVVLLVACLLLAGCSSSPDGSTTSQGTSTTGSMLTPAANTTTAPALPPPLTASCDVTRTNAGTSVGYGAYVDRLLADNGLGPAISCRLDDLFPDDHSWANSALVEVEWTAGAGTTAADAWIESDACQATPTNPCPAPYESATASPLTMRIEGDDYATHAPAALEVQVAGEGVAAQQGFHVTVTLFANTTVDAGFSALD